jgi:hypothetical protein
LRGVTKSNIKFTRNVKNKSETENSPTQVSPTRIIRKLTTTADRISKGRKKTHTVVTSMLDYLWNKLLFCQAAKFKSENFKRYINVDNLYQKVLSVEVIMRKFYELEVLTTYSQEKINLDNSYKIGVYEILENTDPGLNKNNNSRIFGVQMDHFNLS